MRLSALAFSFVVLGTALVRADINVAVVGPMSGQNAVFGEQMKTGATVAIDAVNAAGGVNGERLVMLPVDDACDARRAATVAEDLVRQDVRVVIGHFCSGSLLAANKTYEQAGILVVAPTASSPLVTDKESWNIVRVTSRDDAQADRAAVRMSADNPNAVVGIVSDGQVNGRGLVQRLKERMPSAKEFLIRAGSIDQQKLAADLKAAGINTLYFTTAATDSGAISGSMRRLGLVMNYYGPDTLLNELYWERSKAGAEGALATFATDPASLARKADLETNYTSKGLGIDATVLQTHAAVDVFVAAARTRDVNDGRAMAEWLRSGERIDTFIGPVAFDAKGDLKDQRFTWYRWTNGAYEEDPNQD